MVGQHPLPDYVAGFICSMFNLSPRIRGHYNKEIVSVSCKADPSLIQSPEQAVKYLVPELWTKY